jgi:SRSO17 transposase
MARTTTPTAVRPDDVRAWGRELDQVVDRIAGRFARSEARRRVRAYLVGLLSPVQRKNSWQLAEQLGDTSPCGVQHLLGRADWDPDAVRDDLRAYVTESLHDPQAVLIVDETGFLKKGLKSAGVARQYTGTAGRTENCQVGVFLAYAGRRGSAFLDRALYLPEDWTDAPDRCEAAGIPEGTAFASKPALAKRMLERAFAAGVTAAWVTGDSVYGCDGKLRRWLEGRGQRYVLGVRSDQYVGVGPYRVAVAELMAGLPAGSWRRIKVGDGSKGPRRYDWAWRPTDDARRPGWRVWVLARRDPDDPGELFYFLAAAPAGTTLTQLAKAAASRWSVEGAFEAAKQEVGLADYEVRSWAGWHRHITLALLAHAILAAARSLAAAVPKKSRPPRRG